MLRPLIRLQLARAERKLGGSLDYVRHMLDVSLSSFFRFTKLLSFAQCRCTLPADAFHAACLTATRHEDCGTCLQIGVNVARSDGLAPQTIQAIIERRIGDLPQHLADVARFTQAVLDRAPEMDELRHRVRKQYGESGLVELSLGVAAARAFPTIKWSMGYAESCTRVDAGYHAR